MMKIILKTTGFFLFICITLGITFSARAALRSQPLAEMIYLPLIKYPPLKIVFTGAPLNGPDSHIFVVNDDGTGLLNLTYEPGSTYDDFSPLWSLNGDKIAFQSNRDGYKKIYIMNPDGSQLTRLLNNNSQDSGNSWSPDGTQLSLSSEQSGYNEVYTVNVDGSNMVQLTDFASDVIKGLATFWSPTGSQIAFSTYHSVSADVFWHEAYLMSADGGDLENITIGSQTKILSWSPDGTKLLLRAGPNIDIFYDFYVMSLPSREVVQLTDTGYAAGAAWSPDSSQIVFSTLDDGAFIVNADGTNKTGLFCDVWVNELESYMLAWSPDGTKIAWNTQSCGWTPSETSCGIYVISLENNTCEHIAAMSTSDPTWQP